MTTSSFLESPEFPRGISFNSAGGPTYSTTITSLLSGYEQRNRNWLYPKHEYDVMYGIKDASTLSQLIEFFHVVGGAAVGFRYYDWMDCKSSLPGSWQDSVAFTDQVIGTGDGTTRKFQLIKTYQEGSSTQVRIIKKPITNTVLVGVAGSKVTSNWSVDTTEGYITFAEGHAPTTGQAITAGFEFNVPVRFKDDALSVTIPDLAVASTQVKLIEIRVASA